MDFPPEIAEEIRRRIEDARLHRPGALSRDGKAIRVDGGIGYDCWVSPDGDVYMETYDLLTEDAPVADRSRRAQLMVLSLGMRSLPQLRSLRPTKPPGAPACPDCQGNGWFGDGEVFICHLCCGLGWVESAAPDAWRGS